MITKLIYVVNGKEYTDIQEAQKAEEQFAIENEKKNSEEDEDFNKLIDYVDYEYYKMINAIHNYTKRCKNPVAKEILNTMLEKFNG